MQASFIIHGLQQEGICMDHAADGLEGLHFAAAAPYDVFVIDLMLPKKDGFSLICDIRGGNATFLL